MPGASVEPGVAKSISSLVTRFGALVMKNRVVGSQTKAIGSRHRAIYSAESQHRAKEAQ